MSLNDLALNPIQEVPLPKDFYSKNTVDRQSVKHSVNTCDYCQGKNIGPVKDKNLVTP
jgi:hypothetical protein